jgi:hypothetical protein
MEVKFRVKDVKVFNTIFTYNAKVKKDIMKSQSTGFSGEGSDSCFTSIKLHMICSEQILHRIYMELQKQAGINRGNAAKCFYIIKEKTIAIRSFTA